MDGEIRAQNLATLPETVERCDDGTGEQSLQNLVHKLNLCDGDGGRVAQVRELPTPGKS